MTRRLLTLLFLVALAGSLVAADKPEPPTSPTDSPCVASARLAQIFVVARS